jgi:DedD protein
LPHIWRAEARFKVKFDEHPPAAATPKELITTMPLFNFRRAGNAAANNTSSTSPDSVDVIRKRAKHRLIGASVLVLVGVVGFPLLFDTQPRPIAVDIPIEIPGKNGVKPLVMPTKPETNVSAGPVGTAPAPVAAPPSEKVAAASSLSSKEEILTDKKAVASVSPVAPALPAQAAVKTEAKPAPKPEVKTQTQAAIKPAPPPDDGARAKALLDGQTAAKAAAPASAVAEGRMVVQVGAFADADKAKEVRLRLEKAGLKTYTQVAETKDGKRIRVRVGPFATRAEADKAASKIKTLDLPVSILTL